MARTRVSSAAGGEQPSGARTSSPLSEIDPAHLRLMGKVARMYHERGALQPQIAAELHLSQSKVSRLLKQAINLGIVRTVVTLPNDLYVDLEFQLQEEHDLLDVVVVDTTGSAADVTSALGSAAAIYLGETLIGGDNLGVSSWSATLVAAVDAMRPRSARVLDLVAQLLGGTGDPQVQVQATRMLDRLCLITGAQPYLIPAPAIVSDPALQRGLMRDTVVATVAKSWSSLTIALVGIGSVDPSPMLARSGNALSAEDRAALKDAGAVGDVCLRFFDENGELVPSSFNDRIIGIGPEDFRAIPRRIAVAGGTGKFPAIRAAVRGGWVNVLITDLETARHLLADADT